MKLFKLLMNSCDYDEYEGCVIACSSADKLDYVMQKITSLYSRMTDDQYDELMYLASDGEEPTFYFTREQAKHGYTITELGTANPNLKDFEVVLSNFMMG